MYYFVFFLIFNFNFLIYYSNHLLCNCVRLSYYIKTTYLLTYTEDIGIIVQSFYLKQHTYADDNQIYSSCFPSECASLKIRVIDCVDAVGKWMAWNQLMLNPSKSKFLWCSSPCRVILRDQSAFELCGGSVDVSSVVGNLGVFIDVKMSMNDDINRLVRLSYNQLRWIRSIRHALPTKYKGNRDTV